MSEDFGGDFITIADEEGNEFELELVADLDYKDKQYKVFLPTDLDEDDPEFGFIILRVEEEDGETVFGSVDDEAELNEVYDYYMENLFDDDVEEE